MKKEELFFVGNAHLDPVWLWTWQEGFAEIKATFRSALDRMLEFPEYKFTCACGVYYEWIEKNDPLMFKEIQQRVKEGRWCIVGGWYLQPDCNLPSGESFVRQGLYTQLYFKEKFGLMAKTGYNVDSFGHNGNLPQILKKSGMNQYVFMRPMDHEKELKSNLFDWKSEDGSIVRSFRIPLQYGIKLSNLSYIHQIEEMAEIDKIPYMVFYGVGNHGGGPTIRLLQEIEKMMDENENYSYGNIDDYFKKVSALQVPCIKDDLQMHAVGCYTANVETKKNNRKCENNMYVAEALSSIASLLQIDFQYPSKKLKKAWKNILFNQFHDILGGCAIKEAYIDAGYLYGESMSISEQAINFAFQKISWNINTLGNTFLPAHKDTDWKLWEHEILGTPIVVFNTLPWDVDLPIKINATVERLEDDLGNSVVFQLVRGSQTNGEDRYNTLFKGKIPALGYNVYRMFLKRKTEKKFENEICVNDYSLENNLVKIEFDLETGGIKSFFDKKRKKEYLAGVSKISVLDEEHCDTWAHNQKCFDKRISYFKNPQFTVLEKGPLRGKIRIVTTYGQSIIQQDYILLAGENNITVEFKIDFHEKHKMLKIDFPVAVMNPEAIAEIPYGSIRNEMNGRESVCQKWVLIRDDMKNGIAILNDSKYGFSVENNVLSLSVIRGCVFADHFGERDSMCEFMDQGIHEFQYGIMPSNDMNEIIKKSYELNIKPISLIETFHKGKLPSKMKNIFISESNIFLCCLKYAEDKSGIIMRFYESEKRVTEAKIYVPLLRISFQLKFNKNEIKTVLISNGKIFLTNFLEEIQCEIQGTFEKIFSII